ncbi:AEC family transporter [Halalkalibacterium ligniniphilum]|uniref:AEC family transporter n=1 Tax=Halalkalibacterium ligniniphilum TaxID=1134413 RepID=UPI00034DFA80|nr:AEC family transporter [Halalkalibacterium ligniniphilum]
MDIAVVITTVSVMGVIIGIGTLLTWRKPVATNTKQLLVTVIINVALPSIILNGLFTAEMTEHLLQHMFIVFLLSVAFHIAFIFIALFVARLFQFKSIFAKKMALLAALGNTGFIGIPLCATIFGPVGGLFAAIFDAGLDVVIFSLAIYLLRSGETFDFLQLKALLNIPLFAITIGMLLTITGFEAPSVLIQLTGMLSSLAAPLAMLYIGFLLPPLLRKGRSMLFPQLWFPILLKLIAIPLGAATVVPLLPLDAMIQQLVIILLAMPTFMLATLLFSKYADDETTAVITTVCSTLLSLITIPFIAFMSQQLL